MPEHISTPNVRNQVADVTLVGCAFLEHVLPSNGFYAAFVKETKQHCWFETTDELARALLDADAIGQTVYYACASYSEPTAKVRTREQRVRSGST